MPTKRNFTFTWCLAINSVIENRSALIKINSLFFNNAGSFQNLGMNRTNVLTDNANEKKLD